MQVSSRNTTHPVSCRSALGQAQCVSSLSHASSDRKWSLLAVTHGTGIREGLGENTRTFCFNRRRRQRRLDQEMR